MEMFRKSILFIVIISFLVIILVGCDTDLGDGIEQGIDWISCDIYPGYDYIGGDCCIDLNENNVCEEDEPRPPKCKRECNFPNKQCHNGDVYSCEDTNNDDCKEYKLELNCADDETCKRGECIKNIECRDDVCDEGKEDCDSCPEDCLNLNERCCEGKSMDVECCIDRQCDKLQECINFKCVDIEFCGNEYCDSESENCKNCPPDCVVEDDEWCCEGEIKQGDCCIDEDCKDNSPCVENLCTSTLDTSENKTTILVEEVEQGKINQTEGNNNS